jgi:hypothetical protein
MEQTECSETLAFKLQTPENHPEESARHSEQGGNLKSTKQLPRKLLQPLKLSLFSLNT